MLHKLINKFISLKIEWKIYIFLKFISSIFAYLIYSKLTTLGDTFKYLNNSEPINNIEILYKSTTLMLFLGATLKSVFGPIIANSIGSFLSFYGVYYSINKLNLKHLKLKKLLLLLSFPSFLIWTSIISKESIGVFFMGIILGSIIDLINYKKVLDKKRLIFALYLCFMFKPQYLSGIVAVFIFIFLSHKFRARVLGHIFLFIMFLIFSALILFIFSDLINDLSYILPSHFNLNAASTRANTFWLRNGDFFRVAPYGIFIAFVGPTLNEALTKNTHLIALIESLILLSVLAYYCFKIFYIQLLIKKIKLFYVITAFIPISWILLVHYPFGLFNPGSAIRYRENFIAFIIVLIYFVFEKTKEDLNNDRLEAK